MCEFKIGDVVEGNLNGEIGTVISVSPVAVQVRWEAEELGETVESPNDLDIIDGDDECNEVGEDYGMDDEFEYSAYDELQDDGTRGC